MIDSFVYQLEFRKYNGNTPCTNTLTRILLTCDYLCNKHQNATTLTNQYLQKNMTQQGRKKKVFAHASVPAYGIT